MCTGEGTSILAGFLVFSVLGSMAHQKGVTIQEVAKSGAVYVKVQCITLMGALLILKLCYVHQTLNHYIYTETRT